MAYKFNFSTGLLDIVEKLTLAEIDRLTSITSTAGDELVLTSNGSALTLTGDYDITVANDLTSDKLLVEWVTQGTNHDNLDSGVNVSLASGAGTEVFRSALADMDYTAASGTFMIASLYGFDTTINYTDNGATVASPNLSAFRAQIDSRGQSGGAPQAGTVGLSVAVGDSTTSTIYGAYTKATNAGGQAIGYQGYGLSTASGSSLLAVGVYGFCRTTNGLDAALYGLPFTNQSTSFAAYLGGHVHMANGSLYVYTSQTLQTVPNKTLVNETDDGSVWIEKYLEVDNIAQFDGGAYINADNSGRAGTLGLTNVFPALGGGAAPTLGTIGGSGPSTAAQAGWIKMYNGTTAVFVPYWT